MPRLLLFALLVGCSAPTEPTIATAASLRRAAPELVAAFGGDIALTYGASGTLRMQVEAGAPIDGVLFASQAPVDRLVARGLASNPRVVATNSLALIAPADRPGSWTFATLDQLPAGARFAVGDPGAVPAGRYARDLLKELGSWDSLQDRLVVGGDVSMVLALARRGEVEAAVVYGTEVIGIDGVRVLDRWTGAPRPVVVAASTSDSAEARRFLDFVASDAGQAILRSHGFGAP